MDDDKGEVRVGVEIETFCDRHKEPFTAINANMQFAITTMMRLFIDRVIDDSGAEGIEAFADAVVEAADARRPLCCALGDEEMSKVLLLVPQSTGDDDLDAAAVEKAEPRTRRVLPTND